MRRTLRGDGTEPIGINCLEKTPEKATSTYEVGRVAARRGAKETHAEQRKTRLLSRGLQAQGGV